MKKTMKLSKKVILATILSGMLFAGVTGVSAADAVDYHNTADHAVIDLTQAKEMDQILNKNLNNNYGPQVRKAVNKAYGIDINYVSKQGFGNTLSVYHEDIMQPVRKSLNIDGNDASKDARIMDMKKNQVMDRVLRVNKGNLTGAEIRPIINYIFGINLDGISGLEGAQLSIYSKGQWVIREDTDLLVISSNSNDTELYVGITEYFTEVTGETEVPAELSEFLEGLGFTFNQTSNRYEWVSPDGLSAPDPFKGKIINELVGTIISYDTSNK